DQDVFGTAVDAPRDAYVLGDLSAKPVGSLNGRMGRLDVTGHLGRQACPLVGQRRVGLQDVVSERVTDTGLRLSLPAMHGKGRSRTGRERGLRRTREHRR